MTTATSDESWASRSSSLGSSSKSSNSQSSKSKSKRNTPVTLGTAPSFDGLVMDKIILDTDFGTALAYFKTMKDNAHRRKLMTRYMNKPANRVASFSMEGYYSLGNNSYYEADETIRALNVPRKDFVLAAPKFAALGKLMNAKSKAVVKEYTIKLGQLSAHNMIGSSHIRSFNSTFYFTRAAIANDYFVLRAVDFDDTPVITIQKAGSPNAVVTLNLNARQKIAMLTFTSIKPAHESEFYDLLVGVEWMRRYWFKYDNPHLVYVHGVCKRVALDAESGMYKMAKIWRAAMFDLLA